jgi:hypothetical protein
VALVAAVQNFGSSAKGIPPRPFFSNMIKDNSASWGPGLGKLLKATDYDATRSLGLMGEEIKGELQESIITFSGAPLSDATVAAKGFATPLIDTGVMLNSVDYEVEQGG